MSYQTGTVSNMTDLKSVINTFCTTNGWTLTGSVLEKGLSYVRLTVTDSETMLIEGANSTDFLTTPSPYKYNIYVASASFPITYHLFVQASPDVFVCVIVYDTDRTQQLMWGDMVKIDNAAYVGGNWFWGSRHYSTAKKIYNPGLWYINDTSIAGSNYTVGQSISFMPFCTTSFSIYNYLDTAVHAEIDSYIWNFDTLDSFSTNIFLSDSTISSYFRGLNISDSHSHLITMELIMSMADSVWGYLGYIEHIRLFRIDNYNLGDIITLGTDKWMVFPWSKKELTYPVGRSDTSFADDQAQLQASGGLGFAVRYDGP